MGPDRNSFDRARLVVALTVDEAGDLPLPWLGETLSRTLASQRGHALLVQAWPGVGALPFAVILAQAWLCEAESSGAKRPCGRCASCRLVRSHLHPDLIVLLPETLRREHDWPLAQDKPDGDDAKRKPSRQIRIDEVRALIDWSSKTPSRGRGKVAVLHPATALNPQAANALLKTLEEPPASTRLVLTAGDPASLLPTVRSRCQWLRLSEPDAEEAVAWLEAQGVAQAQVLLAACNGRPLDALALAQAGIDGPAWSALPAAVAAGKASAFSGWSVALAVDALHKICHDAMAVASGAAARYFPDQRVPRGAQLVALADWSAELDRVARHDEHPWNEGLLIEALVQRGAAVLAVGRAGAKFRAQPLDTLPS